MTTTLDETLVRLRNAETILIGVSSCLLGEKVRYDGRHKRDDWIVRELSRYVRLVAVCPEMEIGLGTPREPMDLVRRGDGLHLVATVSASNHTETMRRYAEQRARELAGPPLPASEPLKESAADALSSECDTSEDGISGFIFKSGSPSCGLHHVPTYTPQGEPAEGATGLFAEILQRQLPSMPVTEDSQLTSARLREDFLHRVLTYHRARTTHPS